MAVKRRIGILTGGGDVPGLNVVLKAVVMRAADRQIDVLGLRRGWQSLLEIDPADPASPDAWTLPLPVERVRTFDRTGGTNLHTSRVNPSNVAPAEVPPAVRAQDRATTPAGRVDCTRHVLRVVESLGLDALIAVGGDDTLSFASRLHDSGFKVLAIPKTIDNDVFGTDYCLGFSTAVTRSVDAITAFRTSLGSHERMASWSCSAAIPERHRCMPRTWPALTGPSSRRFRLTLSVSRDSSWMIAGRIPPPTRS